MSEVPVIQFNNVTFSYTDKPLLVDMSFDVASGDFVGIVGPNGGGKTTLIKLILGELTPQSGYVKVFGDSPRKARTKIGYLSQKLDVDLDFPISSYDVVIMGRSNNKAIQFYSEDDRVAVEKYMRELAVWDLRDRTLKDLSGGERQRVFLARALVTDPQILILDEPLVNVDLDTQIEFYKILTELNEHGMTILIVDHNLDMLTNYVKRVLCINKCEHEHVKMHDLDEITKEEILRL